MIGVAISLGCTLLAACGDDPGATGTGAAGNAGSGGRASSGGAGAGGSGASTGGTGGRGGTSGDPCSPGGAGGPTEVLEGDILADRLLTNDKAWLLKGQVWVKDGATLTIEPGTVVQGDEETAGTLFVETGAEIMAEGSQDCPIVFTSSLPAGSRKAGDWGGVVLLGKAPVIELDSMCDPDACPRRIQYGGDQPGDSSGKLQYVRIEFSGIELGPDYRAGGLTLAGAGSGTQIDHVLVRDTGGDCFEILGGTVNAHHLLCVHPGDEAFGWDLGYAGKLQFLAALHSPQSLDAANGLQGQNDPSGIGQTPISDPTIYNVTLCGPNLAAFDGHQQYGHVLRRATRGTIRNSIATGFLACVDVRDPSTSVTLESSICFGNGYDDPDDNVAFEEAPSGQGPLMDDDDGLDERAWFLAPEKMNSQVDPQIDCFGPVPSFLPAAPLTEGAATPPDDGFFDPTATYIGAFQPGDDWASGAWATHDAD